MYTYTLHSIDYNIGTKYSIVCPFLILQPHVVCTNVCKPNDT